MGPVPGGEGSIRLAQPEPLELHTRKRRMYMKTRILSLALALAVCLGLMVPAAASHLQGNNGSDQGGLPMETGATEIVGKNGYVFTLSQPVIGPISNFKY